MSDEKKEMPTGWECPRCGSINAPQEGKCQCKKIEKTNEEVKEETKVLLQE